MQLESIPLDLQCVVKKSLALLRASAADRGVTLAEEIPAELPPVLFGDPLRLQQVAPYDGVPGNAMHTPPLLMTYVGLQIIVNLVNNALKFSQGAAGGGRVNVRVTVCGSSDSSAEPMAPLARRPACLACRVCIEIEDNGPGVPPDVAARLFKPFVQADSSTTRRYGGTGLGLSIVRGFAELMGGAASIVSPNALGGATFVVNVILGAPLGNCSMTDLRPLRVPLCSSKEPADGYQKKPQTLSGVRLRE